MVSANSWSFPHPLLAPGLTDVDSLFEVTKPFIEFRVSTINFEFDLVLNDEDVRHHIENGRIGLRARYKSGAGFTFQSVNPEIREDFGDRQRYRIQIDQDAVRGRVTLEVMLVALERIDHYSLTNQSTVFGGAHFSISPFDIVGYAYRTVFDAKKNYDPLNPPFDSCFRFERNEAIKDGFDLDFSDSEQIVVRLSPKVYEAFRLQEARPAIQIGAIMFPALTGALGQIQKAEDQPEDFGWYATLTKIVEDAGIADLDPYLQAQHILEDPVMTALAELGRIEEEQDD